MSCWKARHSTGHFAASLPTDLYWLQGAAHVRTASLDTSASQFMESLALHDAHASHSQRQVFETSLSADHSMSSRRGHTAHAAADTWPGAAEALVIAGSKRSHESSKSCNRGSKDNTQQDGKKESMHQHKHSFTPALPAVEEMTTEDAIGDDDRYAVNLRAVTSRASRLHTFSSNQPWVDCCWRCGAVNGFNPARSPAEPAWGYKGWLAIT